MLKNILKKMSYPLNGEDVQEIAGNKNIRVVKYSELFKFRKIGELLHPENAAIILYEYKYNMGHWCCIFKRESGEIEFWDPLGYKVDQEFKFIPDEFKTRKYLSQLLYESNKPILYNEYDLQKNKKGISTCGRFVGFRLLMRKYTLEEFAEFFLKHQKDFTPDELVTLITFLKIKK